MADSDNQGPLFGKPAVSPESLKLRRQMLADLLKQGTDTSPIRSPLQGAARMAQTLVGALEMGREDRSEKAAREESQKRIFEDARAAGIDPARARLLAETGGNVWANPEVNRMVAGKQFPEREEAPTYSVYRDPNTGRLVGGTGQERPLTGTAENPPVAISPGRMGIPQPGTGPQQQQPRPAGGPLPAQQPQQPQVQNGPASFGDRFGAAYGNPSGQAIPPIATKMREENAATSRGIQTADMIRKVNQTAWNEDMERYTKSALDSQNLRLLRDTIANFDPTRGNAGELVNRGKQFINGIVGRDVLGSTQAPEFLNNIGNVMSLEIANKGRGTDKDLAAAQAATPTGLQTSKQGALNMVDHLIQMKGQDKKIGETFSDAMTTDPDHYIANRTQWLNRKENALTSPLTGKTTAGGWGYPDAAAKHLRSNPGLRSQFDTKYGSGASDSVLGGQQ